MISPLNTFDTGAIVAIQSIKTKISYKLKSIGILPNSTFVVVHKTLDGGVVVNIDDSKIAINADTARMILCVRI